MDIGKPQRVIIVEPAESPVPPRREPTPQPERRPVPRRKEPAKPARTPEKVPAR